MFSATCYNVFVGDLSAEVDNEALAHAFSEFGELVYVHSRATGRV